MTWLLYAMLVDLTDTVAEALHKPFKAISMEMVFRGLLKPVIVDKHLSLVEQMNLAIPKPA